MANVNRAVEKAVEYTGVPVVEIKIKRMVADESPARKRGFFEQFLHARATKKASEVKPDTSTGVPTGTRPRFWRKKEY